MPPCTRRGLFHMLLPLSLGGGAADLVTFNQVIEALAAADASPAWCLAQAAGELARRRISRSRRSRARCLAHRTRWSPGDRLPVSPRRSRRRRLPRHRQMAVCERQRQRHLDGRAFDRFDADDKPRLDAAGRSGQPHRAVPQRARRHQGHLARASGCAGRRAMTTRSPICSCTEPYSTWRDSVPDRRESGPLYNIPMLTLYGVGFSGVALGIARACLAAFMTLAQTKRSGRRRRLDRGAARQRGDPVAGRAGDRPIALRARLSAADAAEIWADVVDGRPLLARAARASARRHHRRDGPGTPGRRFRLPRRRHQRDFRGRPVRAPLPRPAHVLAQGQAHLSNFEAAGQALFGIEPRQRL